MENFGAIAYSEEHLLAGPGRSSESLLRDTHMLIAHEIAHQWLGDLVTAQSWDHLWLNEGFADWMEKKATQHLRPDWNVWMADGAGEREDAIRFDARQASYPIQPNHSFDGPITYRKSGQVIRMIEAYLGEDVFRDAIRAHVRKHAFGNAVSSDIWLALEDASELPVTAIGRDFTEQKGVPLIDVLSTSCLADSGTTRVVLRQDRFGLDAPSKARLDWHVPVTAAVVGSSETTRQVVSGAGNTTLSAPGCGPVKVNVAHTGYFRTRYDTASFTRLVESLPKLPPADQLGLLNDTFNLAEGGYVPFERYLDLAARTPASADPMVLFHLASAAQTLDGYLEGLPSHQKYRAHARERLATLFSSVGWDSKAGEPANLAILRSRLIEALGQLGDSATRTEALRRFRAADQDPSRVSAQIADAVVNVVGMAADQSVLQDLAQRAASVERIAEKTLFLSAGASARDPAVARRALEMTLDGSVPDDQIPPMLIAAARQHARLTFEFFTAHFDALRQKLPNDTHAWLAPAIAANGNDAAMAHKLDAWAAKHIGKNGRHDVAGAKALILLRDEVRRKRLGAVGAWLEGAESLLLLNGNVYTADTRQPRAEAVVTKAGRIVFVGSSSEAKRRAPRGAQQLDLQGLTVFPGLTDSHAHLDGIGMREITFNVEGVKSLAELQERLRAEAPKGKPGEWLSGGGWIESHWTPQVFPTRQDIDAAVADRPVLLWRADGHGSIANSLALRLAGIDRDTTGSSRRQDIEGCRRGAERHAHRQRGRAGHETRAASHRGADARSSGGRRGAQCAPRVGAAADRGKQLP